MDINRFFSLQEHASGLSHGLYDVYSMIARVAHLDKQIRSPSCTQYQVKGFYQGTNHDYSALSESFENLNPYGASEVGIDPNFRAAVGPYKKMGGRIENIYTFENLREVSLYPSQSHLDFLTTFLSQIAGEVEDQLGYCWSVLQSVHKRTFQNRKSEWHTDQMHPYIVKIIIFLDAVNQRLGSTQFYDKEGALHNVEGPAGSWILLDVNSLKHSVCAPIDRKVRRTIEVTIGPSPKSDPTARCAMKWNCHHAFLPWTLEDTYNSDQMLRESRARFDRYFEGYLQKSLGIAG